MARHTQGAPRVGRTTTQPSVELSSLRPAPLTASGTERPVKPDWPVERHCADDKNKSHTIPIPFMIPTGFEGNIHTRHGRFV